MTYDQEVSLHYHRLITDQHYWLMEHQADVDAQMAPALYYPEPPEILEQPYKEPNENLLLLRQRIDHLQAELNFTRNKLNEHLDKPDRQNTGRY
jgi:hypothetical protein